VAFPDHQQPSNQEYASIPAPFTPVPGGAPTADEVPAAEPAFDNAALTHERGSDSESEPEPEMQPEPAMETLPEAQPEPESESRPEAQQESEPDSALPTMTDLRSVATDLDDIDEILARLDDDESAADDEPDEPIQASTDAVADDPEDQDPLLATR